LSASSFNLREGTRSASLFGSGFLSVHAGGVSLAGAGVQVVSAPAPLGFVISSGMDNKGRIKICWDNNEDLEK